MRLRGSTAASLNRRERWATTAECDRCGRTLFAARPVDPASLVSAHRTLVTCQPATARQDAQRRTEEPGAVIGADRRHADRVGDDGTTTETGAVSRWEATHG